MDEVTNVFDKQAEHYSAIITDMKNMKAGIDSGAYDMRAMNIEDGINNVVENFKQVCTGYLIHVVHRLSIITMY